MINQKEASDEQGKKDKEFLANLARLAVSSVRVLDRILGSEFGVKPAEYPVQPPTCLPVHRPAGSRKLALAFVDIRNFTNVTHILRLMGSEKLSAIELLMEHFCLQTARAANAWGRLDKFIGDGVLVLFGEELLPAGIDKTLDEKEVSKFRESAEKVIVAAVCFSIAVFKGFNRMVNNWLDDKLSPDSLPWRLPGPRSLLRDIRTEHCEDINLGIGIGLNFGTVYMDYFGDTRRREYTAIGDNVNLCDRLCHEAGRYSRVDKKRRPPILISQPVYEFLKDYLVSEAKAKIEKIYIQLMGMGIEYPVYGLESKYVDHGKIEKLFRGSRYEEILNKTLIYENQDWDVKD